MVNFEIRKKCQKCGLEYWEDGRVNKHTCDVRPSILCSECGTKDCVMKSSGLHYCDKYTPLYTIKDGEPIEHKLKEERSCGNCRFSPRPQCYDKAGRCMTINMFSSECKWQPIKQKPKEYVWCRNCGTTCATFIAGSHPCSSYTAKSEPIVPKPKFQVGDVIKLLSGEHIGKLHLVTETFKICNPLCMDISSCKGVRRIDNGNAVCGKYNYKLFYPASTLELIRQAWRWCNDKIMGVENNNRFPLCVLYCEECPIKKGCRGCFNTQEDLILISSLMPDSVVKEEEEKYAKNFVPFTNPKEPPKDMILEVLKKWKLGRPQFPALRRFGSFLKT